jgi:hypothetical protein
MTAPQGDRPQSTMPPSPIQLNRALSTLDWIGWIGMGLILAAYTAVSFDWMDAGATFQVMNLVGSVCTAAYLAPRKAWPPLALNVVWALIALLALANT